VRQFLALEACKAKDVELHDVGKGSTERAGRGVEIGEHLLDLRRKIILADKRAIGRFGFLARDVGETPLRLGDLAIARRGGEMFPD
jgi:hypothetical protein